MALHDLGREVGVIGSDGVPNGLWSELSLVVPRRHAAVQGRCSGGVPLRELHPEQIGEQVVVSPPAPIVVQCDQEESRPLSVLEDLLAVGADRHCVAQIRRQVIEDRRLEQEFVDVGRLAIEDLFDEEVQDEAMAPREGCHERGRVRVARQRQPCELQADRPPLGSLDEHVQLARRNARGHPAEQVGCFVPREPQISLAKLDEFAACPSSGQREGRVGPAEQHEPKRRGCMVEQQGDRGVNLARLDCVVVVDDQHDGIGCVHQRVVDAGDQLGRRRGRVLCEVGVHHGDERFDIGDCIVECGRHMAPEPDLISVRGIGGHPGDADAPGGTPRGDERALAEPGRRAHDGDGSGECPVEPVEQTRPRHEVIRGLRHVELRRQHEGGAGGCVLSERKWGVRHGLRPASHCHLCELEWTFVEQSLSDRRELPT